MKSKTRVILAIILELAYCSCSSQFSFEYNNQKKSYQKIIDCLYNNYPILFPLKSQKTSVSIYPNEFSKMGACSEVQSIMEMNAIEFAVLYSDSTVALYAISVEGIKKKQHMLMFANTRQKIVSKMTTDMVIRKEINNGWYELEKIITLAN